MTIVSLLLGLGASALATTAWLGAGSEGHAPPPSQTTLEQEVASLRRRLEVLEAVSRSPALAVGIAPAPERVEAIDFARIEAFVRELLARPKADGKAGGAANETAAMLAELAAVGRGPRADELWAALRASGGIADAVAHFERLAAAAPGSPDAQTDLGIAYVQQMLASPDEATRIDLGKRIESQFTKALTIAPDHWEARFRLAVGQSYGPALSGTRQQAISNFEQLVKQQSNVSPAAGQELTYQYLGRLYAEQGDPAKAAAVWGLGLQRHPRDAQLRQLVEQTPTAR